MQFERLGATRFTVTPRYGPGGTALRWRAALGVGLACLLMVTSACSDYGTTGSGGTTGQGGEAGSRTGGLTTGAGAGSSGGAGTPNVALPDPRTPPVVSAPATQPARSAGTGGAPPTVTVGGSTGLPAISPTPASSPSPLVIPAVSGSATPIPQTPLTTQTPR